MGTLRQWIGIYTELAKARLSALVVITTAVGYAMGAAGEIEWGRLLLTLLGTALAAGSANGLNQVMEQDRDARMPRTRTRPLPSDRIHVLHAAVVCVMMGGAGLTILAAAANLLTASLGLTTILLYLLLYTPLKVRSTLNTLVGAVVGAIPPMMGWTAATGEIGAGAWVLAATLFVWQIPHFLALAWLYRKDYELGGYRMLPIIDPTGVITCRAVLMWSLALVPVTLAATWIGMAGWFYAAASLVLGAWLIRLAALLYRKRTNDEARKLFLATVMYLPLLLGLMVLDRTAGQSDDLLFQPAIAPAPAAVSSPATAPSTAPPSAPSTSSHAGL
jgi:protoheme IX farnesyltransferase